MNGATKKATERAIEPAYKKVEEAIKSGNSKWHVGDDTFARSMDDLTAARRKSLVAYETCGIVQLRRGRTFENENERREVWAYAESLVK